MFKVIHMRTKAPEGAIVINTCSDNDTAAIGTTTNWSWANPTNRRFPVSAEGVEAASTECMWQGMKVIGDAEGPNPEALAGAWRKGKAKRPKGHWSQTGLITSPGEARRRIYLPAYIAQIHGWVMAEPAVRGLIRNAKRAGAGTDILLRDFDIGQGIEANRPMSHAWVLSEILNKGQVTGGGHSDEDRKRLREITEATAIDEGED